ncbi:MAG: ABC transporter permease [Vicinamibacterales bacterium]
MSLETLLRECRFAVRSLRRDAGFSLFAVAIAALGIGACVTVFGVVNALILKPLPFAEPDRLVWIANHDMAGLSGQTTQVGHMLDLRDRTQTLEAVAGYFAFYGVGDTLLGDGEPERLSGVPVSRNFFDVLGVPMQIGRGFTDEESRWNGPRAVILAHGLWARRFESDPAIIGRRLTLNGEPYTVVGVLPASFDFATVFAPGGHFDLYFPFPLSDETNRWGNTMAMVGRLKPGVDVAAAASEVRAIGTQLTAERSDRNSFEGVVTPLAQKVSGGVRPAVWVLAGAVGLVMLIVCANLAGLLLARSASRQKELAIRTALGAGRGRLLVQSLAEGLLLSGAGAVAGVGVAVLGTRIVARLDAVSIPLLRDVSTDGRALGFAVLLAIVTGVVFGLAPAVQARGAALIASLKDASRGSTEGRSRLRARHALVVAEVAFACVLLVGAGLLTRSLLRVFDVNMGFQPERAVTTRVDPVEGFQTREALNTYVDEVLRRVRDTPGISAAGLTDALPLGRNRSWGARARGVVYERGQSPSAYVRVVSDGYVTAMGIPIVAGRDFTASDTPDHEPVMLVNETMARALWPGDDAVGQYVLGSCSDSARRVIGVVGDVRHLALERDSGNEMYIPVRQCPDMSSVDLVVRSTLPPSAVADSLRAALEPMGLSLPGGDFRTLQEIVDRSVSSRRFLVLLLGGFAAFALVLASLGIYGLISYSVHQRLHEMGVRLALGAPAGTVRRQVLGQTLRLAAVGVALGAGVSWVAVRSVSGLLFGISPRDPATFAGMAVVLTIVALIAGYLPARRASRVDPMMALRAE